MQWAMRMKEIVISRINRKAEIIPTDMDGTVHHQWNKEKSIDSVIVYYGSTHAIIDDGVITIRGYCLVVDVDVVKGRERCLVVKVQDTTGKDRNPYRDLKT